MTQYQIKLTSFTFVLALHCLLLVNIAQETHTIFLPKSIQSRNRTIKVKISAAEKPLPRPRPKKILAKPKKKIQKTVRKKQTPNTAKALGQNIKAKKSFNLNPYLSKIRSIINKDFDYPPIARRLNHQGVINITFRLNRNGKLIEIKNIKGEFETLKVAVKELVQSARFPKFPPGLNKNNIEIQVPVNFTLN